MLLQPNKKNMKKLREVLYDLYKHLDSSAAIIDVSTLNSHHFISRVGASLCNFRITMSIWKTEISDLIFFRDTPLKHAFFFFY